MKRLISRNLYLLSKNKISIMLAILLFISLFYNIKLKSKLDKILTISNIKGTYQNENILDPEYFVFSEGEFYRYKQF